jgi:hypothetical protein
MNKEQGMLNMNVEGVSLKDCILIFTFISYFEKVALPPCGGTSSA